MKVSWKLAAGVLAIALASLAFPFAFTHVPFSTGGIRCGTAWDDSLIDPAATVAESGITDPTDQGILLTVLSKCRDEARQRVGAAVSIGLMILVIDALCLVQAGRLLARPHPLPGDELLHFA
jgi:hypothetical protein